LLGPQNGGGRRSRFYPPRRPESREDSDEAKTLIGGDFNLGGRSSGRRTGSGASVIPGARSRRDEHRPLWPWYAARCAGASNPRHDHHLRPHHLSTPERSNHWCHLSPAVANARPANYRCQQCGSHPGWQRIAARRGDRLCWPSHSVEM